MAGKGLLLTSTAGWAQTRLSAYADPNGFVDVRQMPTR
jgi:hypothetical protein